MAAVNSRNSSKEELKVYEINSKNIKTIILQNEYTWVHLWRPFCSAEYCQNIGVFQEIDDRRPGFDSKNSFGSYGPIENKI